MRKLTFGIFLFVFQPYLEISFWAPKWHRTRIKIEHKMGTENKRISGLINKWVEYLFIFSFCWFKTTTTKINLNSLFRASPNFFSEKKSIQLNLINTLRHFSSLFYIFCSKNIYCFKRPNWVSYFAFNVSTFRSAENVTFSNTLFHYYYLYLEMSDSNLVVFFFSTLPSKQTKSWLACKLSQK